MVTDVSKRGDAALVEKTFGNVDMATLPQALSQAMRELARLARGMSPPPDDISLSLDLPVGILKFRCWRRAPAEDQP